MAALDQEIAASEQRARILAEQILALAQSEIEFTKRAACRLRWLDEMDLIGDDTMRAASSAGRDGLVSAPDR
jgi:hypothetical protein